MRKRTFFISLLAMFVMAGVVSADMYVSSGPLQEAAVVEAYWTPDRMKSAIPYPMGIDGEPTDPGETDIEEEAADIPGNEAGSSGERPSMLLISEEGPQELAEIQPASSTYPFPHTTYLVRADNYQKYPERTVGKVFFTKQTGGNFVCSGSSIGGRAVLTAGHCVSDGARRFHRNWSFVPAYYAGSRPYGTWTAASLWTFTDWHNFARYCRDVGFAVTNNVSGRKLSQRVGWLGFSWNQQRNKQHWNDFGYPAAAPWTGNYMVQTAAEWARNDSPGCSPSTVGIGTSQRPGFSGGPWIRRYHPDWSGAINYANGVNSYYYISQPNGIYSPYFDSAVRNFKNQMVVK